MTGGALGGIALMVVAPLAAQQAPDGIRPSGNDNALGLIAARLGARPADRADMAVSVAYSRDEDAPIGGGFVASFRGERTLVGVDAGRVPGRRGAAEP